MAKDPDKCQKCHKSKDDDVKINLKHCAKCMTTTYCSRACQKADWKEHKKVCPSNAQSHAQSQASACRTNNDDSNANNASSADSTDSAQKGPITDIDKPFHALHNKTWLHDRPELDVYTLLIDTYRLRMEDNYMLKGKAHADSVYGGATDRTAGFRSFLITLPHALLPDWWSVDKSKECFEFSMSRGRWTNLNHKIHKSDIVEYYGDDLMPMQLRLFGEQVYRTGPGGQRGGNMMLQMQMKVESGELFAATIDTSRMSGR